MPQASCSAGFWLGRETEARRILEQSIENRESQNVTRRQIAVSFLAFDDMDRAIEWFERSYDEHDVDLVWVNSLLHDGMISDASHADPRFQDLLRRMNIPV